MVAAHKYGVPAIQNSLLLCIMWVKIKQFFLSKTDVFFFAILTQLHFETRMSSQWKLPKFVKQRKWIQIDFPDKKNLNFLQQI